MIWQRKSSMSASSPLETEIWIRNDGNNSEEFNVKIFMGKKTDLLTLKNDIVQSIEKKIKYYQDSRRKLYSGDCEYVSCCPVTGIDTRKTRLVGTIYGAEYVQTPDTGHVYVKNRPTKSSINDFYLNDVTYAATYTDRASAESRLNAIAVPWLDWMVNVYQSQFGVLPKRILDVGSGAGHFVEACRRAGLEADGIELSTSSRKFAKDIWGVDLDGRDFLESVEDYQNYDVVTFWGLLEHTPNPGKILSTAKTAMRGSKGGMVISKVPRWHSLSTASQLQNPDCVIRHADPMGHIMLFSDASAAELYYKNGFKPTSAWYYGMDVYEMLMQAGSIAGNHSCLSQTKKFQIEIQQHVDEARFSDGLTLVGVKI